MGGAVLPDREALEDGLTMLAWLLAIESAPGHLSVVPARGGPVLPPSRIRPATHRGRGPGGRCARAHEVTGSPGGCAASS